MDGIDGKIDWPLQPDGTHPLTELYLGDYLVVDVAKPYAEDSYLEIEQALLQGRAHATCGGRSLNDDAGDTNLTFLITGGNGPRISDGVDQATVRASDNFPYLAPPNPDPVAAGRTWLRPRSPTNSPFSEQPVWRAAEQPKNPGEQSLRAQREEMLLISGQRACDDGGGHRLREPGGADRRSSRHDRRKDGSPSTSVPS